MSRLLSVLQNNISLHQVVDVEAHAASTGASLEAAHQLCGLH